LVWESDLVDKITFEVVNSSLTAICRLMGNALYRTAYSTIIVDCRDFSCAVLDRSGELIAQQEGCPIHVGTLHSTAQEAFAEYGIENVDEGDVLVVNDPYRGGIHLPDVTLFAPIVWEGEIVAWVGNRAHWPDIGGTVPSSLVADAKELIHEGLRIPPIKIRERGKRREEVIRLILANVRAPSERLGDLNAQLAAIDTGVQRVTELIKRNSLTTVLETFEESMAYARRRASRSIEAIPEGVYTYEDVMDDVGVSLDPVPIRLALAVKDGRISIDFEGTGAQVPAPLNSSISMTKGSVYIILKALLDPYGPSNSGWYDLVEIVAPSGSILNPDYDAPVFGGGIETGMRVMDCVQGALAPVLEAIVTAAPYGTIDTTFFTGIDPKSGEQWLFNDPVPGGYGAGRDHDGLNTCIGLVANVRDVPVEVVELRYPLRISRSELRENSGGNGKTRGGLGAVREIEVLADIAQVTIQADRTRTAPWGLLGGGPGARTKYSVIRSDGSRELLGGQEGVRYESAKKSGIPLSKGDTIRIESGGGGGYGDPRSRPDEVVLSDLKNGYISEAEAREFYGLP
jgi:N-methylhydantoinase B